MSSLAALARSCGRCAAANPSNADSSDQTAPDVSPSSRWILPASQNACAASAISPSWANSSPAASASRTARSRPSDGDGDAAIDRASVSRRLARRYSHSAWRRSVCPRN